MITFSQLGIFGKSRLGNQMFQYAAVKAAALNAKGLCAIPFDNQQLFDCFDLDCKYYSLPNEGHNISQLTKYSEQHFNYESRFNTISDNTDLEGYFQSEKYFIRVEQVIRNDFKFRKEIYAAASSFIDGLNAAAKNLISVHVRRGDYVQLQNFHPVCSVAYYNQAMATFKDCHFVVFSDDIAWCQSNLRGEHIFYSNLETPAQDLCAMTMCHHHIIANSSYSWWGAWLGNHRGKQVIAPRNWFGKDYSDKNTDDLYCKDWMVI